MAPTKAATYSDSWAIHENITCGTTSSFRVGYYTYSGGMADVGPTYEFRIPGRLAGHYARELADLRARNPGVPEKRLRELVGHLYLWYVGRMVAAEYAERYRRFPPERPAQARTEWGMVHRERCVHRMGVA